MADQNQNSQNQIPGTLRTLKTDLEMIKSNPQDRLQQAGNFVQVRPEPINTPTHTVSALDIDSDIKPQVTKQDIPEVNSTLKSQPNYSWSNMSTSNTQVNNAEFKPTTPQAPVENKSGFSVLDDSIDLPLDNTNSINKGSSKTEFQPSASISNQSTELTSKVEPSNQAPAFDINSLNLQDDAPAPSTKKSSKGLFPVLIVVLLLSLIGGGLYFYFNISGNTTDTADNTTDTADNTDINIDDTEDNNDSEEQSSELISPLIQDSAVDIAFVDSEPIRRTIVTVLTDKSDTLIQLNFIKDNNPVSLIDIADVLGVTIPLIGTINDYGFYAYNQQGIYKLVVVLGLPEGQDAKTFVENWSNSIPRDMAGFSINLPSRIVNAPRINKSIITNNAGKTFENYYYNYTSPADSIDVSSYENYVLMASSQDSMKYILEEIR